MAQSKTAKIMAILALSGIIISIIGTGILYFINSGTNTQKQEISQEELQQLIQQAKINATNTGTQQ